jgi:hypothetical protein
MAGGCPRHTAYVAAMVKPFLSSLRSEATRSHRECHTTSPAGDLCWGSQNVCGLPASNDLLAGSVSAPAVPQSLAGALALLDYDDRRRSTLALSSVQTARQPEAHTRYR